MTTTVTPTSELEAVNTMLGTIGESPVTSLSLTGLEDLDVAKQVLSEVSRAIQSKGWHFNTEIDYELTPDVDGYLIPPSNTLRIDTTKEYWDIDVVMRGNKLYHRKEHTSVFTEPLKAELIVLLEFSDLPEAARYYITIRASRVFQRRMLGAELIEKFTEQDEMSALTIMQEAEGDTADHNMLTGSYSVATILQR